MKQRISNSRFFWEKTPDQVRIWQKNIGVFFIIILIGWAIIGANFYVLLKERLSNPVLDYPLKEFIMFSIYLMLPWVYFLFYFLKSPRIMILTKNQLTTKRIFTKNIPIQEVKSFFLKTQKLGMVFYSEEHFIKASLKNSDKEITLFNFRNYTEKNEFQEIIDSLNQFLPEN